MFCGKCGEEITQNAKFCQSCGAELCNIEATKTTKTTKTTNSNDKLESGYTEQNDEKALSKEKKNFIGGINHPWRRFFARTIDLMSSGFLILFIFSYIIGYLFPYDVEGYLKLITDPIGASIVLYLVWLPFEALFLSISGTTPAKWVFGIRVTSKSGEKLSYASALNRAFLVFLQGEGIGIPLVTLFTRLFAYRRLTKTGTTLWDESINSVVTHKKWGVIRAISSVFITFVVLVLMSILNQMSY